MAIIKGKGAPTIHTPGFIGDRYMDEDTGIVYKCTFAFKMSFRDPEYEWTKTNETLQIQNEVKPEPVVEKKSEENHEEVVEETVEETKPNYNNKFKNNYNKQYRK